MDMAQPFELRVVMLSCMNAFQYCYQNRHFEQTNSNIRNNSRTTTNPNDEQQHLLSTTTSDKKRSFVTRRDRYDEFYLAPGIIRCWCI